MLTGNTALGGAGGNGGSGGSGGAGGTASGGGIYTAGTFTFEFVGGQFVAIPVPATVTATNDSFIGNLAQGGSGGAGDGAGSGGQGGQGAGGGAYNDAGSTLNISSSLLTLNTASGGLGGNGGSTGVGGSGGNGFGGGAYNAGPLDIPSLVSLPGGTLDLTDDLIVGNFALGKKGGKGATNGNAGQGVGGGLYLDPLGTASLTRTSVILNVASTSDPNIFGSAS